MALYSGRSRRPRGLDEEILRAIEERGMRRRGFPMSTGVSFYQRPESQRLQDLLIAKHGWAPQERLQRRGGGGGGGGLSQDDTGMKLESARRLRGKQSLDREQGVKLAEIKEGGATERQNIKAEASRDVANIRRLSYKNTNIGEGGDKTMLKLLERREKAEELGLEDQLRLIDDMMTKLATEAKPGAPVEDVNQEIFQRTEGDKEFFTNVGTAREEYDVNRSGYPTGVQESVPTQLARQGPPSVLGRGDPANRPPLSPFSETYKGPEQIESVGQLNKLMNPRSMSAGGAIEKLLDAIIPHTIRETPAGGSLNERLTSTQNIPDWMRRLLGSKFFKTTPYRERFPERRSFQR